MCDHTVRRHTRLGLSAAMRLFGLTGRALRYYEELGLIEAQRDRRNTRYYDAAARERLGWIAPLRAVGVPVAAIRAVLDGDAATRSVEAVAVLERRRAETLARLDSIDVVLANLRALPVIDAQSQATRRPGAEARGPSLRGAPQP